MRPVVMQNLSIAANLCSESSRRRITSISNHIYILRVRRWRMRRMNKDETLTRHFQLCPLPFRITGQPRTQCQTERLDFLKYQPS
jgi:hypothetical protein